MIFKNDYISLEKPYFMKMKDEMIKHFKVYKNLIKNQLNMNIKHLQSDEEGEYAGIEFMNILKKAGIQWELSALYMPV